MIGGGALTSTSASYPVPARRLHPARIRGRSVEPGRDRRRRRERPIRGADGLLSGRRVLARRHIRAHHRGVPERPDRLESASAPQAGFDLVGGRRACPPSGRRTVVIRPAYG